MRQPNHASRFEGIAKTNWQASRASDTETLQSQVNKAAKKRLSLNGLEILHGRLFLEPPREPRRFVVDVAAVHAVRSGPGTVRLPPESAKEYVRTRFPGRVEASKPGS